MIDTSKKSTNIPPFLLSPFFTPFWPYLPLYIYTSSFSTHPSIQ
nr:MAG TPA: hypothetical protein [Caudoviricetes sp.]